MKRLILTLCALFLSGCASLSKAEKKELAYLRCEKVANQIAEIRSISAEASMFSLGYALHVSGMPEHISTGILQYADTPEAGEAANRKYADRLGGLTYQILRAAGCQSVLDEIEKEEASKNVVEPTANTL